MVNDKCAPTPRINRPSHEEFVTPLTTHSFMKHLDKDALFILRLYNTLDEQDPDFKFGITRPKWFKEIDL